MKWLFILLCLVLMGCSAEPPLEPVLQAATAIPTLDPSNVTMLCEVIEQQTDDDLEQVIEALLAIERQGIVCTRANASEALYNAYVRYGEQLEAQGLEQEAINAYILALSHTEMDTRARDALVRLGEMPSSETSTPTCDEETPDRANNIPDYTPSSGSFVTLESGFLTTTDGQPFTIYGVIYEPRDYPGKQFLAEAPEEAINEELFLIAAADLNTIRIYLYHDVLFQCAGASVTPVPDAITRLDQVLTAAAARGLRVIPVLHHDADDTLYLSAAHTTSQLRYLVGRYADEPAILAWDVRDGGDLDYTLGDADRDAVLVWVNTTTQTIRQTAPNHLVTAGWRDDAAATAPFADFVSFQHEGSLDELRQEIALLQSQTEKPLFLANVSYPMVNGDELTQRDSIYNAVLAAQNNALLGWSVYNAFDHPRTVCEDCEQFGLWYTNYSPKLALDALSTAIRE